MITDTKTGFLTPNEVHRRTLKIKLKITFVFPHPYHKCRFRVCRVVSNQGCNFASIHMVTMLKKRIRDMQRSNHDVTKDCSLRVLENRFCKCYNILGVWTQSSKRHRRQSDIGQRGKKLLGSSLLKWLQLSENVQPGEERDPYNSKHLHSKW